MSTPLKISGWEQVAMAIEDVADRLRRATQALAAREYLRMSRLRELKAVSALVDFCDVSQQLETLELDEMDFPRV